MSADLRCLLSP